MTSPSCFKRELESPRSNAPALVLLGSLYAQESQQLLHHFQCVGKTLSLISE